MATGNRDKWEFPYPADTLKDAALAKQTYHQQRLDWWKDKKAEVIAKIRAEGLEIDESIADAKLSNSYSRGPTVTVRDDLERDLQECVSKVREHDNRVKAYHGWLQVLSSQGKASFTLLHDDWLFFFGK